MEKATSKRLKLYIWRAGIVAAACECQWPCGLQRVVVRSSSLGNGLLWGWHSGAGARGVPVPALGSPTLSFRAIGVAGGQVESCCLW